MDDPPSFVFRFVGDRNVQYVGDLLDFEIDIVNWFVMKLYKCYHRIRYSCLSFDYTRVPLPRKNGDRDRDSDKEPVFETTGMLSSFATNLTHDRFRNSMSLQQFPSFFVRYERFRKKE